MRGNGGFSQFCQNFRRPSYGHILAEVAEMADSLSLSFLVLLGIAVVVTVLSAVGVAVMRDPYQKLHYIAPPASLGVVCVVAALFIGDAQKRWRQSCARSAALSSRECTAKQPAQQ